jgi:hypothetical protein
MEERFDAPTSEEAHRKADEWVRQHGVRETGLGARPQHRGAYPPQVSQWTVTIEYELVERK